MDLRGRQGEERKRGGAQRGAVGAKWGKRRSKGRQGPLAAAAAAAAGRNKQNQWPTSKKPHRYSSSLRRALFLLSESHCGVLFPEETL